LIIGEDLESPVISSPPPKVATVEFKLVEDLRLVTIPVTSCLIVLASYIFLGTVLFSTWEGWNYLVSVEMGPDPIQAYF